MFSKVFRILILVAILVGAGLQGAWAICDQSITEGQITITTSLTEKEGDTYIYRDQTPFTVTVEFPAVLDAAVSLPTVPGFIRTSSDSNTEKVQTFEYAPQGESPLNIIIDSNSAVYSVAEGCYNIDSSNELKIIFKAPGNSQSTGVSQPPAGGTAGCDEKKTGYVCKDGKLICDPRNTDGVCCGIKLLTNVPFIGKCIVMVSDADAKTLGFNKDTLEITESTAFPRLMLGLTKILVTVILLASFIAIIVAGVMIAASGAKEEGYSQGTKLIGSVIAALALLGASGVILRLINPNFFG